MSAPPGQADNISPYFALQADIGISKHMGGRKATDELVALCQLWPGQLVLEIGCGVGSTTSYLAERYGCRVVGVDLSPGMIARARQHARRRLQAGQVDFQTADAQALPFLDSTFDAVVDESVTAFVSDKQRALNEYTRVVKPGGYVGLNEATWMQPPSPAMVKYVAFIMAGADFQNAHGWRALLDGAGLVDLQVRTYPFDAPSQFREELRTLDLAEQAAVWRRFLREVVSNPVYRRYTREILADLGSILDFTRFIGHGLYAGRKAGDGQTA